MFKNFIVLAYRHFVRSPLSSAIEILGMTAGLTVFLLVLLWVSNETSYDEFNKNVDRIYRLESTEPTHNRMAMTPPTVGPLLERSLPEVEKMVRIRYKGTDNKVIYTTGQDNLKTYRFRPPILVDNSFFELFSFEFISGNPKSALNEKNTAVITESMAKTMFGNEPAIGKTVKIVYVEYTVTGVIKDVPNFHIPSKMMVSLETEKDRKYNDGSYVFESWRRTINTYLLVNDEQNIAQLETKINSLVDQHRPEKYKAQRAQIKYHLRPLDDIYFNGGIAIERDYAIHGDRKKIVAYVSIAFFTLLLACVNFINLNNAKSLERAKEIGIKKVAGATRSHVFFQFFGEVSIMCVAALVLAVIFTHSLLNHFNELMDAHLLIENLFEYSVFSTMIIGLIILSLLSGGLPALYISSFHPLLVMKGLPAGKTQDFNIKKVSLTLQFAVTIILLIGSLTVFRQAQFMKNADLGFDTKQLISFHFHGVRFSDKIDIMKQLLKANPDIHNVSLTKAVPGENNVANANSLPVELDGLEYQLYGAQVDEEYQKTLGLQMVEGRFYEKGRANDLMITNSNSQVANLVINQTAMKLLGLDQPTGSIINTTSGRKYRVIGVIQDFHLNSSHNPILPMVFINRKGSFQMIASISPTNVASTIQFAGEQVEKITGANASMEFLDNSFGRKYSDEENFARLIGYFTTIAILIACMGLLGIATHAIKLRIKEIGIRKTMGASSMQILSLITLPFIKSISLSALLGVPIAWLAVQSWLDNYPYRTDLPWWVLGLACGLTFLVATFTIIWQSWKASSMNPARLIRYE